ncbi:MAG: RNA ligase family protein, partial [Pseudomonadota bacterium]
YFLGFAWIVDDTIQSWPDTLARFAALGIEPVPTLYLGPFHATLVADLAARLDLRRQEGFVLRRVDAFPEAEMPSRMGKYVRAGHVQSDTHWTAQPVIPNSLAP